jgi:molecular chaperone GrpE
VSPDPTTHGDPLVPEDEAGEAAAETGKPAPEEAPVQTPEAAADDPVAAAEARAQEYLDLAQRKQAEFENFRKRMNLQAAQAEDRGMARLAKELLPALDHLELALAAAEKHAGEGEWVKGIRLVQDEVTAALGRAGIQPFAPFGEPFDPNEHEAVAQQPVEGREPGTVTEVYQQGYRLNGAVLRPARVVVAA